MYSSCYNVILGRCAANGCNDGDFNAYDCNVVIGHAAAACACCGSTNVMIGHYTGFCHRLGHGNTQIGCAAGKCNLCGCYNTYLGAATGCQNNNGNYNVAIGYQATLADNSGSCQLVIAYNSSNYWLRGDNSKNIQPGAGIKDCTGVVGSSGQVLQSTGSAIVWANAGGGGGGDKFNTTITNSAQTLVQGYEQDAITFSSDSTKEIHNSIN